MKKKYVQVDVGDTVYVVYGARRDAHYHFEKDIVFEAEVTEIRITKDGIKYVCKKKRCVTDKNVNLWEYVDYFYFRNANINTGHCGAGDGELLYRVFTTKEACIKWLRG